MDPYPSKPSIQLWGIIRISLCRFYYLNGSKLILLSRIFHIFSCSAQLCLYFFIQTSWISSSLTVTWAVLLIFFDWWPQDGNYFSMPLAVARWICTTFITSLVEANGFFRKCRKNEGENDFETAEVMENYQCRTNFTPFLAVFPTR